MLKKIAHSYKTSFTGLSRESWLLSGVLMINRAGTMAVPFMSMYVTQHMHRSLSDAGLVITLFGIGSVLGATSGGYLTDKVGFRSVQIVAALGSGLLFILYAFVTRFQTLCALTVVLAFVAEAFRPANITAIAAYARPDKLTRSYSLNRLAINLGWSVGGAVGGLLASVDYRLLFWVDGGTNILAGILIILLLPNTRKRAATMPVEKPPQKVLKPWQDGFYIRFMLLTTLFTTCFFLVFRLVPVFWKDVWLLGETNIGLVLGLNGLIIALFEMVLVNRWEGRRPAMHYIIAGCLANALGYLVLMIPGLAPLGLAILCMGLMTIGEMLAMPFMNSLIMGRTNAWNRGQYAAGYTLSWSVAQIIGPAGGAMIAQQGGYNLLWIIMIVFCLLAGLGFRWLENHQQKAEHYA
jgi:predicted MFS family arabinose efflux permease